MLDELKSRIPEFNIFRNLNLAGKIFFIAVPIPGIRNLHSVIASVFPVARFRRRWPDSATFRRSCGSPEQTSSRLRSSGRAIPRGRIMRNFNHRPAAVWSQNYVTYR